MTKFGILMFDGVDELDVFGPWEVLRLAARHGGEIDAYLGVLGDPSEVWAAYGTHIVLDRMLDPAQGDWIVVPGGGWATRSERGAWAEVQRQVLPKKIATWRLAGLEMASVCTGAMLLAAGGVARGRPVTTHHCAREELEATGAVLVDARIVDDGDLITAAGVTSGLDLGLWIVERFAGPDVRGKVEDTLEYRLSGVVHHGPNSVRNRHVTHSTSTSDTRAPP